MLAFYAAPHGISSLPVVLVVQEIFGVHEYIADTARRFAEAGHLAIAPELFARQGDPGQFPETARLMAELVSKVPDAQAVADLGGAVQWAGAKGGDLRKRGRIGFCWGDRITWWYAKQSKNVKAGVAWYGRLVGATSPLTPRQTLELAASLKTPVLGLYSGQDSGILQASVDQMQQALAGKQGHAPARLSEFVVYPEALHALHADDRPSFRKEAAEDGF